MAMIDMNVQDDDDGPMMGDGNCCPCIYLSDAQCKALGITIPPAAGAQMMLKAMAVTMSVTQSIDGDADDPDVCMRLMLTHIELGGTAPAGKDLYEAQ